MKLLFDQNLSPALVERLADMFPQSVHVRDVGLPDVALTSHSRDAQENFLRSGLFGFHSTLLAVAHKLVNRSLEFAAQTSYGDAVEADDAAHAENSAGENVVPLIEFDAGGVILVPHGVHGHFPH